MKRSVLFICMIFLGMAQAHAIVLPGWLDWGGKPVHTEDEVDVRIDATVARVAQGYRYTFTLTSLPSSRQHLNIFEVYLPDPHTGVVPGTENSPWAKSRGWFPYNPLAKPNEAAPPDFVYPPEYWRISWVALLRPDKLQPGMSASGFTFVSPFPPGVGEAYVEGYSNPPVQRVNGVPLGEEEAMPSAWLRRSKYGPGKVVPVIGPVKPATPGGKKYAVLGCAGGVCDVQLDITGSMDPTGAKYTYQWTGPFGSATGARPVVRLAPGAHTVSVTVSNAQGVVLATATLPVAVANPNLPTNPPAGGAGNGNQSGGGAAGGTAGGGNGQGAGQPAGDLDHDGIPNDQDDDRDGDGKPNDQDANPDHPD